METIPAVSACEANRIAASLRLVAWELRDIAARTDAGELR